MLTTHAHVDDIRMATLAPTQTTLCYPQVPVSAGEAELRTLFAPCGTVSSINMLKRPGEASHKGCGFVEFATWAACEKAIDAHNGVTTMAGSRMPLVVKFADARRPPPTGPVPITGLKRGSVGDAHWQGGGKRPSLQVGSLFVWVVSLSR